jgi:transcriptional regulator GlxA family with amidase domain
VVTANFQVLSLSVLSVFEFANAMLGKQHYDVYILSEDGRVRTSFGADILTSRFTDGPFDTVIVSAAIDFPPATAGTVAFLKESLVSSRRIASTCVGAFTLAEAGLLDGRRATTHWAVAAELSRRFPHTKVEPDRIFVQDGQIWTSAGVTSGMDLALAMVEQDLGHELAKSISKTMVLDRRRSGNEPQISAGPDLYSGSDRIEEALQYARQNLGKPLPVASLAEAAKLSPRQFSRVFRATTGQSPAKAIEKMRLEVARHLVENTATSIQRIVRNTGFGDSERMRRSFVRSFGFAPQVLRSRSRKVE